MPTKKKPSHKKAVTASKKESVTKITPQKGVTGWMQAARGRFAQRKNNLLARRPHRSFRRTRRRDYARPLSLPGYWALTNEVRLTLWRQKRTFLLLMFLYAALTVLLIGTASQGTYTQLGDLLRQTSGDIFTGNWGQIGQATLLLGTAMSGDLTTSLTEGQQIYAVILILFSWLTTVWLLRAFMAGKKPRLRDGLYNAGAPIIPSFLILLVMVVQLLPTVVAALAVTSLLPFGILDAGATSMLFWLAVFLLGLLSLYWLTSSFMALVIITLPGMYPLRALTVAGDLVIGRRIRILFRLLWMLFVTSLGWAVVMTPVILFDAWIKGVFPAVSWLPIVPIALLVMGSITVVWMAAYVYVVYRRIVDDGAAPA